MALKGKRRKNVVASLDFRCIVVVLSIAQNKLNAVGDLCAPAYVQIGEFKFLPNDGFLECSDYLFTSSIIINKVINLIFMLAVASIELLLRRNSHFAYGKMS